MDADGSEGGAEGVAAARILAAGPYRLDLLDERLWHAGEAVRLGGKALSLLRVLMEQPQTLVTKDELFERVWPGVTVSESVLTTAVKELRQALGDDARRPSVIETVHGRGYRFLLPVKTDDAAGPAAAEPLAGTQTTARVRATLPAIMAIAAALVLAVALGWFLLDRPRAPLAFAHPKSVAVMPFKDLSAGRTEQWFADGLTEEVLSTLARTADLRVAAHGVVRDDANGDLREAARAASVAHVLTGSVRRAGGRLRVTADLVRASDGVHVWSQSYDRSAGDIITIQEDIGLRIAQALKTVTDPQKLRAMAASGTRSVAAYEAYLRGLGADRRHLDEGDVAYSRAAARAYEDARRLDPTFAAAHWQAAMGGFGATRVDTAASDDGLTDRQRLDGFFERVDAAILHSPDETEALKYRAARAAAQLQLRQAHQLIQRYLEARPRDLDGWERAADYAAYVGDRDAMVQAARRLNVLSTEARNPQSRAVTLLVHGLRADEALDMARSQLRQRPDRAVTLYQAHRAAIWAGKYAEAAGYLGRLRTSSLPRDNLDLAELRQACAEGRTTAATELYRKLWSSPRVGTRYHAAQLIGDAAAADRALAPLDTPDRLPALAQFAIYPSFSPKTYPRLQAALAADGVRLPAAVAVPGACARPV